MTSLFNRLITWLLSDIEDIDKNQEYIFGQNQPAKLAASLIWPVSVDITSRPPTNWVYKHNSFVAF